MQNALKIVAVVIAAVLAAAVFVPLTVSADLDDYIDDHSTVELYDMPNVENYPKTDEGFQAYYTDFVEWLSLNASAVGVNAITAYPLEVARWFGVDDAMKDDIQGSFPDPRSVFSQYYNNGGTTEGKSVGGGSSRGGSTINDGLGGKLVARNIRNGYEIVYISSSGEEKHVNGFAFASGDYSVSASLQLLSFSDGVIYYRVHVTIDGDYSYYDDSYAVGSGASPSQPSGSPVLGKVGGVPVRLKKNDDGSVSLVDDDGNEYKFNPDGTVTMNGDDFYFDPDLKTLTDDSINEINDLAKDWALLVLSTVNNINKSGCSCKDYTDILKYIANQTHCINKNTDEVESLLKKLVNGCESDEEKEKYFTEISGILLALSNILPYETIVDGIKVLEEFIFKGNGPSDVTVNIFGTTVTVLDSKLLTAFATPIAIVRNVLGFIVLYLWLIKMREKVTSI